MASSPHNTPSATSVSGAVRAPGGRCGAVVLAAGGGTRFVGSTHKLLAPLGDAPVVRHVLDAVATSGISPVIVVTGAVALDDVLALPLAGNPEVLLVHNSHWRSGMASSLHCALRVASEHGLAAVVIGLGDQPGVPASAWQRVATTNAPIAVATYNGVRRNPVRIHAELWDQIPRDGDEGARTLIRVRPELVTEVACEGNADDIDTADDVARWQQLLAR